MKVYKIVVDDINSRNKYDWYMFLVELFELNKDIEYRRLEKYQEMNEVYIMCYKSFLESHVEPMLFKYGFKDFTVKIRSGQVIVARRPAILMNGFVTRNLPLVKNILLKAKENDLSISIDKIVPFNIATEDTFWRSYKSETPYRFAELRCDNQQCLRNVDLMLNLISMNDSQVITIDRSHPVEGGLWLIHDGYIELHNYFIKVHYNSYEELKILPRLFAFPLTDIAKISTLGELIPLLI